MLGINQSGEKQDIKINDQIMVTFNYKNSHGLHDIVKMPDSGYGGSYHYVIYQDSHDATEIKIGDYCICYVVGKGKRFRYRNKHYYLPLYVLVDGIRVKGSDIAAREKYFDKEYKRYFGSRGHGYGFSKHQLRWEFSHCEISKQDLDSIFRKELWR